VAKKTKTEKMIEQTLWDMLYDKVIDAEDGK
jgi:hypothetical protein